MRPARALVPLLLACVSCGGGRDFPPAFQAPSAEMKPSGYRVAWGEHWFPARVPRSAGVRARVSFRNTGTEVWPGNVHCVAYFVPEGAPISQGRDPAPRLRLQRPVAPGQSVTLERFMVSAPARPGDYRLVFDLVNEMVAWFSDRGASRLVVPVRVE